ncbi:hypothetical protein QEZ54_10365 [Catellatospora sp. KI3]|uniref:hypothetical protein n=1 Tax=Catellatospora sp. KI3 TaxID=3041620 RepID=UPI0024831372|nr:hypothetical protein [Catellatospora sp. KI3]MDI1461372.1 hypothetical protein [Catellatospora sp. KI3]
MPTVRAVLAQPRTDLPDPFRPGATGYLHGRWEDRNRRNVPGPIYTGETDTCLTGRLHAPRQVLYDEGGQEFVYRQPTTAAEVHALLTAAEEDPFQGYAVDGDEHWTADAVRAWWRDRSRTAEWIAAARGQWHEPVDGRQQTRAGHDEYAAHLADGLHSYLLGYAYWLDNRRVPQPGELLPEL